MHQSTDRQTDRRFSWDGDREFSHLVSSLAFKPLLIDTLFTAISNVVGNSRSESNAIDSKSPIPTKETIPLSRTKQIEQTIYMSAIALKLQKVWQQPTIEIARAIAAAISLPPEFSVDVIAPGWIQFQLAESGLGTWLQRLNQISTESHYTELPQNTQNAHLLYSANDLFLVQYAHARCCSLLCLGDRCGAIALWEPKFSDDLSDRLFNDTIDRYILRPHPIPWLNSQNQLRLIHQTERTLIAQFISTFDSLSGFTPHTSATQVMKLATQLSERFLTFYRSNRIFGQVQTENLVLAQARLGLIRATQIQLKLLLEQGLGVLALRQM